MLGDHVGVHHEAAGGHDDRVGTHDPAALEGPPGHARDGARRIGHQVGHAGLVADLGAGLGQSVAQQVHHQLGALGVTGDGDLVAARRRTCLLLERPDLLVAGEHQPLGAGLDDRLLGVVGPLELEAEVLQPPEVLDRAVAVGTDLVVLGVLGDRDEVLVHLLGGVLVAGRLLHRRTPAEVEVPARHRRGASVHRGALEQQHPGPRPGGLERGAAAGDAEADHDHVEALRAVEDRGGQDVGNGGAGGAGSAGVAHALKSRTSSTFAERAAGHLSSVATAGATGARTPIGSDPADPDTATGAR